MPLAGKKPKTAVKAHPFAVKRRAHEGTILVVDDDHQIRRLIHKTLQRNGYEILVAGGAFEALQIFQHHPRPIQLLVTDVDMPGMNGTELAQRLRSMDPQTSVLLVSNSIPVSIPYASLRSEPGTGFLQKPFRLDALLQKVRELLYGSDREDERAAE
jgi:DNA-binding NtrC family response regulator